MPAESYTFRVVGISYAGQASFLNQWGLAVGGKLTISDGDWSNRIILNPVPVRVLTYDILDQEEGVIARKGESVLEAIQRIELSEPFYIWRGAAITPDNLYNVLLSFLNAIQVVLHIEGERRAIGWVPAHVASKISNSLENFYVSRAELNEQQQLSITITKRNVPS